MNRFLAASLLILATCADGGCGRTTPPTAVPKAAQPHGLRIRFTEDGSVHPSTPASVQKIADTASEPGVTDVFIFSHGWWHDPASAECRYGQMIQGVLDNRPANAPNLKSVLVGIYWPSAVFPVEADDCAGAAPAVGGTAATASTRPSPTQIRSWANAAFPAAASRTSFATEVDQVSGVLDREQTGAPLDRAEENAFVRTLMTWRDAGRPPRAAAAFEGPAEDGFDASPEIVAERWRQTARTAAFGAPRWLGFANVFTFWTMKTRAGTVGSTGGHALLAALQPARARGVRVHLIGHSFGGKLLSSALTGTPGSPPASVDSLIILQGAFSHFAFSTAEEIRARGVPTTRAGLYAGVRDSGRVEGPLVVTFSRQDVPNRVVYPRGAALSSEFFAGFQDREAALKTIGKYGSVGANGIQGPEARSVTLATERLSTKLQQPGVLRFNVDGENVITGHSEIANAATFGLIWDVIEYVHRRR